MIDKEQVQRIATLARLKLQEQEVETYQQELSQVLDYFDTLQKVDTDKVEPMTHSTGQENISREDEAQSEKPDVVERIMELVPHAKEGFLKVKSILSGK